MPDRKDLLRRAEACERLAEAADAVSLGDRVAIARISRAEKLWLAGSAERHAADLRRQAGEGDREWTPHDGGDCPVPYGTLVEVQYRSFRPETTRADKVLWRWGSGDAPGEIVAWRQAGEAGDG